MKSIAIDFSRCNIGVIAKQGEHNNTQLIFTLPDTFAGADYINAEFKKSNKSIAVVEQLTPENGTIIIPLTQELTDKGDWLDMQLVAYAVSGVEITEIAKSSTVRGVIRNSLNVLYKQDKPGFIERFVAFIHEWSSILPEINAKAHEHVNKEILDSITAGDISIHPDWSENDSASKNYIANRTHWTEMSDGAYDYATPDDKVGLVTESYDISSLISPSLPAASVIFYFYKIGEAVPKSVFGVSTIDYTNKLNTGSYAINDTSKVLLVNTTESGNDSQLAVDVTVSAPLVANVVKDNTSFYFEGLGELVVHEAGLYAGSWDMQDIGSGYYEYVTRIYYGTESVHPLDNKFLSDTVNDAVVKKHVHANQSVLDEITSSTLRDVALNKNARHSHGNLAQLNTISAQTLTDIADNTSARHTHLNDTVLNKFSTRLNPAGGIYPAYDGLFISQNKIIRPTADQNGDYFIEMSPFICYQIGEYVDYPAKDVPEHPPRSIVIETLSGHHEDSQLYEYYLEFSTGAMVYEGESGQTYKPPAPTLIMPDYVNWVEELTIEPNKHYQISIVNDIALWCDVDLEAEEEEE